MYTAELTSAGIAKKERRARHVIFLDSECSYKNVSVLTHYFPWNHDDTFFNIAPILFFMSVSGSFCWWDGS